ncbi:hypothetical protein [Nocardia noduli]|uniref:hypothetical protein n=1 Tax=Nocardia noduli TaxID=2815722 RepID=UPI001C23B7DA|nr:hypothetical protein [Nocardia noduli]
MTGNDGHAVDAHHTSAEFARSASTRIRVDDATIARRHATVAVRCGCPESARSVLGGVHVSHDQRCLHGEPRRYVWCYAGALYTGSLADYGEHFQSLDPDARYRLAAAGDELRTWTEHYRLEIATTPADGFRVRYRLAVVDEWVDLVLDPSW